MRLNNKSGIIIIVVVWILTILTVFAISLGHRASIEMSLTKYGLGQLRAKAVAYSGLAYALGLLRQSSQAEKEEKIDTLYKCGVYLSDGQEPQDIFHKEIQDGVFDLRSFETEESGIRSSRYGFMDEERKINLNALAVKDYKALVQLLLLLGENDQTAEQVASSVIDWKDDDDNVFNSSQGAESDYYLSLARPYNCKNAAFDSIQELLLVRGMTSDLFKRVRGYVTVFPKEGTLLINFDTASPVVLRALARSFTGDKNNTTIEDADSLVDKIVLSRSGEDGLPGTADDRLIELNEMALNSKEQVVFLMMQSLRTKISNFFRVKIKGTDHTSGVASYLDAVIRRDDLRIVEFQRK